jgi:hypothetical protein
MKREEGSVNLTVIILAAAGLYLALRCWGVAQTVLFPPPPEPVPQQSPDVEFVELARARDRVLHELPDPERDPFHQVRRATSTTSRPKPPPPKVLPPELNMILVDQVSPEVQITVEGEASSRLTVGGSFRGWTVLSISSRSCVVEKDGRTFTLSPRRTP